MGIGGVSGVPVQMQLVNDLARIVPDVALGVMIQNFKNMVALEILDSFLDAQGARIKAEACGTYNAQGCMNQNIGDALTLIAIA